MATNKPPQRRIQGIRGSIPSGYLLGRISQGEGDVELVSPQQALGNGLFPSNRISLTMPAQFSVAGSPVTNNGTFTVTWANESPNLVLAGPTSGGAAAPAFRALVAADIPNLGANPSATASDVAVNGSATTYMRSDGAPAVQKASASVFGIVKVDGTTVTASGGVISSTGGATGANPTATAGLAAINGVATTYMRSDAAPAVDFSSVNPMETCIRATTAASDTSGLTYNNGTSGVGATLTGSVNTAITFDGATIAIGQRVLVKNDTQAPSGAFNGVYVMTQLQTASLPPILTRAANYNSQANIGFSGPVPVRAGTVNANTSWITSVGNSLTVGTTPITYVQFSSLLASANPTATASNTAVNGTAATYMRSDAAPAVQKASSSQFGIVEVDGTTITASSGIISAVQPAGANPTATANDTAVNGVATTFMRSDAAPAVQKASSSQFGIVEVDGTTITAAAGVISSQLTPRFFTNSAGGSGQALTQNVWNKITDFGSPLIDDAAGWDATNKVWTVPAGKGGTYFIFGQSFATFSPAPGSNFQLGCTLTKNGGVGVGTSLTQTVGNVPAGASSGISGVCMVVASLSVGDKLQINTNPTATGADNGATLLTYFGAVRIGP